MARIELMPGIESISGTIGNLTFRTRGGKTFVHAKSEVYLPLRATRQEREKWLRATILDRCVSIVQEECGDMHEAIRQRPLIRQRLAALYGTCRAETSAMTKLQQKMLEAYHRRYRQA